MGYDCFTDIRREGREKERKCIAKKMKRLGIFTDDFISKITLVSTEYLKRCKLTGVKDCPYCGAKICYNTVE